MSGFQTFTANGRTVFNATQPTMSLTASGTVTTRAQNGSIENVYSNVTSRFVITYTGASNSAPLVFISPAAESALERLNVSGTTYTWTFISNLAIGATTPFWVFDRPSAGTNFGLEVFDASGGRVYQTSQFPLRMVAVPGYFAGMSSLNYFNSSGRQYAVGYGAFLGDVNYQVNNPFEPDFYGYTFFFNTAATKTVLGNGVNGVPTGSSGVNVRRWNYHSFTGYSPYEAEVTGSLIVADVTNYGQTVVIGGDVTATMNAVSGATSAASTTQDFVRSVTTSGGTPTGYSWSLTPTSGGGSWSIISGQGTAQATARVTGVATGTSANATFACTVSFSGTSATANASSALQFTNSSVTSLSLSPTTLSTSASSTTSSLGSCTATAVNGTATSYSWTVESASGGTFTVTNSTSQTCSVSVSGVASGTTATGTLRCTAIIDGVARSATASLSHQHVAAAPSVTFSLAAGTYFVGQYVDITASQAVVWTYTRTGTTGRNFSSPASGGSSTIFVSEQYNTNTGLSTSCTVDLTASLDGTTLRTWSITLTSPGSGDGGGIEN
jgi:hypothetical protein